MTLPPEQTMRVTLRLRFRDLDTLGHVNQSVYHVMLEEARVVFLRATLPERSDFFVLARVELDHRHEIRIKDHEVHLDTALDHVGTSSIRLVTRMTVPDGRLVAEAVSVLVAWDPEARGARPLSDAERVRFAAVQGALGV